MCKKPWYIWLSIVAFSFLWLNTVRGLLFFRRRKGNTKAFNSWIGALGNCIKLVIVYLILPTIPFLVAYDYFLEIDYALALVINCIQIIALYFGGVFITYKHYLWREENLPQTSMPQP